MKRNSLSFRVYWHVFTHPRVTAADVAEAIGHQKRGISQALVRLWAAGRLKRSRADTVEYTYWPDDRDALSRAGYAADWSRGDATT